MAAVGLRATAIDAKIEAVAHDGWSTSLPTAALDRAVRVFVARAEHEIRDLQRALARSAGVARGRVEADRARDLLDRVPGRREDRRCRAGGARARRRVRGADDRRPRFPLPAHPATPGWNDSSHTTRSCDGRLQSCAMAGWGSRRRRSPPGFPSASSRSAATSSRSPATSSSPARGRASPSRGSRQPASAPPSPARRAFMQLQDGVRALRAPAFPRSRGRGSTSSSRSAPRTTAVANGSTRTKTRWPPFCRSGKSSRAATCGRCILPGSRARKRASLATRSSRRPALPDSAP